MDEENVTQQNDIPSEWQEITMTTERGRQEKDMLVNGTLKIELGIDADEICVWWGDGSQGPLTTHTYEQAGVYNIRVRAKNITFLDVSDCFLQTLDVQQAVDLTTLLCSMNNLRCLQLAGLTKLRILDCYNNHLELLDLRDNPALLKVNCI